jgi:hypothetical protein
MEKMKRKIPADQPQATARVRRPTGQPTGRPLYRPTPESRRQVATMAGFGIHQTEIARVLSIDAKTLRVHFRDELDTGMTQANMRVAQALYTNAVNHNNVAAQIWWTKARMGWRDATDLTLHGSDPVSQHLLTARLVSAELLAALGQHPTPTINGTVEDHSDPVLAPAPRE